VEHKKSGNTAFVVIPALDAKTVNEAQRDVNSLIVEGRKVIERKYSSLEEAKKAEPGLRANEERIQGEVRVVEIENHDVAACAMEHAVNIRDCDFFLVTRISKNGNEYEIDFAVGQQAKETAALISEKLMNICSQLGANTNTVENTVTKMKAELDATRAKLLMLGKEKLKSIVGQQVGKFMVLKGALANLDDEQIIEFAGTRIAEADNIVALISNLGPEMAKVVFARSEKLGGLDCSALFKSIVRQDGRGGGKPHFATGVVRKETLDRVFDEIVKELARLS
jgi:alanyl-tRNA synthetase